MVENAIMYIYANINDIKYTGKENESFGEKVEDELSKLDENELEYVREHLELKLETYKVEMDAYSMLNNLAFLSENVKSDNNLEFSKNYGKVQSDHVSYELEHYHEVITYLNKMIRNVKSRLSTISIGKQFK